ncbi:MAG TPA: potassium channel family protein [Jiangellaceae bacterium]|nr:potassium channel family protein [Jiangellaceae bacterium]
MTDSSPRPRRVVRLGLLLVEVVALVAAYFLMPLTATLWLRLLAYAIGLALVTAVIARQVRRHVESRDNDIRIESLALAIVLAVLLFALVYYSIETVDPSQLADISTRLDALYFSLTIGTTTGFGDISAQGQLARGVVSAQLVFDLVIIAAAVPVLTRTVERRRRERAS